MIWSSARWEANIFGGASLEMMGIAKKLVILLLELKLL